MMFTKSITELKLVSNIYFTQCKDRGIINYSMNNMNKIIMNDTIYSSTTLL